ncbi:isocitrate/isopropylmalate dehydrogenase family protein [Pseudoalteromonas piscicida]|uniref:3-isopropylmalate dehydrogenase n=1 Tax=Pseudoalteromonas piscicida TaxID=43662 RepID=A0A2A5JMX9_PSEO7|nr:isocitrate/isopropylmalate dehydrogenase family protein [Pseudoalteromonas piscicida]PCK30717.1 3-isopropylmalate dehydrogenase [Pseudoalteromonas piscicida]
MKHRIAVIPGDGIGIEVVEQGLRLLDSLKLDISYQKFNYDANRWLEEGVGLTDSELENLKENFDAIYFGALGDPRIPDSNHARQILLKLRFDLDLFANVRPIKLLNPDLTPIKLSSGQTIDCVIIRENTEDLYRGIGGSFKEGTVDEIATDQRIHSYKGVERIIRYAFEFAIKHNRKKVTLVDKVNVLIYGGSLWNRVFEEVAEQYPDIESDYMHIDVAAMRMVTDVHLFDVIVTSNMFGDILSDIGAGIVGGLGLLSSANINTETIGLYEPVHGSAPDIAGKNQANPMAAFITLSMMLADLGYPHAQLISAAVEECIRDGLTTVDLGGDLTTHDITDIIIDKVTKQL